MRTWRSIEAVYGRAYMQRLKRRILITNAIVFVLGILIGWFAHG